MKRISLLLASLLLFVSVGASATSPPPIPAGFDIYREPIATPEHLDWLWRDYLVNGNVGAIGKIATALKLSSYSGSLNNAKKISSRRALTQEEKQSAYLDAVFQSAMWSLQSNAEQHSGILAELIRVESVTRGDTDPSHAYLLMVLSRVAPDRFKVIDKTNGLTFSTPTGEVRFSIKR